MDARAELPYIIYRVAFPELSSPGQVRYGGNQAKYMVPYLP